MNVDFNKNGNINTSILSTTLVCKYDTNYYVEPDGSTWIRIVRHNNPGTTNLFSKNDTFTTSVYKDENRWFNASLCNYFSKWELMVKQKTLSTSTEIKYRWEQYINPMVAKYTDVTKDKVAYNTSLEYSRGNTDFGGLFNQSGGNAYLVADNQTNGTNWWGAFGANTVTTQTSGTGLPGFGFQVITTGYSDLYIRIDNEAIIRDSVRILKDFILVSDIIEY